MALSRGKMPTISGNILQGEKASIPSSNISSHCFEASIIMAMLRLLNIGLEAAAGIKATDGGFDVLQSVRGSFSIRSSQTQLHST
jgi:hypothetical protein